SDGPICTKGNAGPRSFITHASDSGLSQAGEPQQSCRASARVHQPSTGGESERCRDLIGLQHSGSYPLEIALATTALGDIVVLKHGPEPPNVEPRTSVCAWRGVHFVEENCFVLQFGKREWVKIGRAHV